MKLLKFRQPSAFAGGSFLQLVKRTLLSIPASSTDIIGQWDGNRGAMSWSENTGAQWFSGEQRCRITSDLTANTTTTLTDVTGLVFPVLANTNYGFEFELLYSTALATTGLKVGLNTPAAFITLAAGVLIFGRAADGAGTGVWTGTLINNSASDSVISDAVETANIIYPAIIRGSFLNGANAGNLQLQWASEVAASGVTPRAGSSGRLWMK